MFKVVAVPGGVGDTRFSLLQRLSRFARRAPCLARRNQLRLHPGELIQKRTVAARRQKAPIVVLAVDLHQRLANGAQGLAADTLIVDESAGRAVGAGDAAEKEAVILPRQPGVRHQGADRVICAGRQSGGHLPVGGAFAHQPLGVAKAEREAERVEKDGLARPGLSGQHVEAAVEDDLQPLDQDNVADRKAFEHTPVRSGRRRRSYGNCG